MSFACQFNLHLSEKEYGDMALAKKYWLYTAIVVMLLCVLIGAFLLWRASQPVEPMRVYALPKSNPKRAEILKRALQPPKHVRHNSGMGWHKSRNTRQRQLPSARASTWADAESREIATLDPDYMADLLEQYENNSKNSDFPPVPKMVFLSPRSGLSPVIRRGDKPNRELIGRVLIKLWNQGDHDSQAGAFERG